MDRVYLTGIYVLHPLFGINTSADILLARYVKPREIIPVRFQSLAEFHIPLPTLSGKTPMALRFIAIVTLTELSRLFNRKAARSFSPPSSRLFDKVRNILAVYFF